MYEVVFNATITKYTVILHIHFYIYPNNNNSNEYIAAGGDLWGPSSLNKHRPHWPVHKTIKRPCMNISFVTIVQC